MSEMDAREMYLSNLERITDDDRVLAAIAALRGELLDENTCRSAAHVIRKAAGRKHRHPRTAKALRLVAAALEETALAEKWDREHGMHLSREERSARRRELGEGAPEIPWTPPQVRLGGGMVDRMHDPYRKHWLSDREYEVEGGCIAGPDCPECNPGDLSDAGGRVEP